MCLCYYGEVLCQEEKCPHVKTGCRRLKEKEHGVCCGLVICGTVESLSVSAATKFYVHLMFSPAGISQSVQRPYWTTDNLGSIAGTGKDFSLLSIQTGPETHPLSSAMGNGIILPGDKVAGA
jgi:hypothetical protein